MTLFRYISLPVHAGLETIAAPLIMAAPFVLGFGEAATVISVLVGVLLLSLALQLPGPRRSVSLSAHASFDYALATFAIAAGIALGFATDAWTATAFLVGIGAAQVALTASTRFSAQHGI
jgi:hypothetical protein